MKHDEVQAAKNSKKPAAFRRLCVETRILTYRKKVLIPSRLQAAVC